MSKRSGRTCEHILLPVDTQKNNLLSQLPMDKSGDKLKMEIEKVTSKTQYIFRVSRHRGLCKLIKILSRNTPTCLIERTNKARKTEKLTVRFD